MGGKSAVTCAVSTSRRRRASSRRPWCRCRPRSTRRCPAQDAGAADHVGHLVDAAVEDDAAQLLGSQRRLDPARAGVGGVGGHRRELARQLGAGRVTGQDDSVRIDVQAFGIREDVGVGVAQLLDGRRVPVARSEGVVERDDGEARRGDELVVGRAVRPVPRDPGAAVGPDHRGQGMRGASRFGGEVHVEVGVVVARPVPLRGDRRDSSGGVLAQGFRRPARVPAEHGAHDQRPGPRAGGERDDAAGEQAGRAQDPSERPVTDRQGAVLLARGIRRVTSHSSRRAIVGIRDTAG